MHHPPFVSSTLAAALLVLTSPLLVAQTQPTLLQAGVVAPDFVSKDLTGRDVRLADFAGKVVVLDFWATWCGPCIQSLPHVQEVAAAHKADGVVVLAVCTSDSRARYEKWMKENAAKYPDVVFTCDPFDRGSKQADERASAKLYHVSGLPTKFVIGKDGKVSMAIVGSEDGDVRLEAGLARAGIAIDAMVAKKGEEQEKKIAREEAAQAAEAAACPQLPFIVQLQTLKSGAAMPDVRLLGADGKEFSLASLRGKPVVIAMSWHEIVPKDKLNELVAEYGGYGVQTLSAMVFTARADFDVWVKENQGDCKFQIGVDPVGRYEGNQDPDAEIAFHRQTVVAKVFGGGMYPPMPLGLVVDAEGRFVGGFRFAPEMAEGLGNLLLRAGVKLKPEHMPAEVAPAAAFVIAPPQLPPAREEPVQRLAVGAVAPDFTSQDLANKPVKLSDFLGKIVVLDFWATWCGPCKASLPHTQEVAVKYRDQGVVVLANCTGDARKAFESWLQQNQGDYPDIVFTHDQAEKTPERASRSLYGVEGIPEQFVIGKDGKVVAIVSGYMAGEVLLEAALAKAGVKVDPEILQKADGDQKKRDASRPKSGTKAVPLSAPAADAANAREGDKKADEQVPGYLEAIERGDTAAALAALNAAFEADPALEAKGFYQWKFGVLMQGSKPAEVDAYVRDLQKRMPDNADVTGFASACIVACSEAAPRFDKQLALEMARKTAAVATPDSRWQQFARWRLGWALYHVGEKAKAVEQMQLALDGVKKLKASIDFGDLEGQCAEALTLFKN